MDRLNLERMSLGIVRGFLILTVFITALWLQQLKITANHKYVYNPSAMTLWFSCDGETVKINGGETLNL